MKDEDSLQSYYGSLIRCMWTLLIDGTFMDSTGQNLQHLIDLCTLKSLMCVGVFLGYIFLTAMTLMNLLVGVLCEIVMNETSPSAMYDCGESSFLGTHEVDDSVKIHSDSVEMHSRKCEAEKFEMDAIFPMDNPTCPRFRGLPRVEQPLRPLIPADENKRDFESKRINPVQPDVCIPRNSTASTTNESRVVRPDYQSILAL